MKFLVSFKSEDEAVIPVRGAITICAPTDVFAREWAQKQSSLWLQSDLTIGVGLAEGELDEYMAHRDKLSSNFVALVNKASQERDAERAAAAAAFEAAVAKAKEAAAADKAAKEAQSN